MTEPGHNRLAELANGIRQAHRDTRAAAERAAERALAAGTMLVEAKALVKHGEWAGWLAANVPEISERTAQRYMGFVKAGLKTATVADLGIRGASEAIAKRQQGRDYTVAGLAEVITQGRKNRVVNGADPGFLSRTLDRLVDEQPYDMREELRRAFDEHPAVGDQRDHVLDPDDPTHRPRLEKMLSDYHAHIDRREAERH